MIITGNALISVEEKDIVDGVLQIPEGIITIEKFACSGCQERIKKNVFPSSVKKIKKYAFLRTAIRDLIIPESVEEIEEEAFMECRDLKYIYWPSSVPYMENYMFLGCQNLLEVHFPDGMKMIGHRAFMSCKKLKKVSLPDSIEWLGFGAFYGCELLEFISLSKEIRGFYTDTFAGCKNLTFLQYGRNQCSIKAKEEGFSFLEPTVLQTKDFLGYDMQGHYFLQYQDIISVGKDRDAAARQIDRLFRIKNCS